MGRCCWYHSDEGDDVDRSYSSQCNASYRVGSARQPLSVESNHLEGVDGGSRYSGIDLGGEHIYHGDEGLNLGGADADRSNQSHHVGGSVGGQCVTSHHVGGGGRRHFHPRHDVERRRVVGTGHGNESDHVDRIHRYHIISCDDMGGVGCSCPHPSDHLGHSCGSHLDAGHPLDGHRSRGCHYEGHHVGCAIDHHFGEGDDVGGTDADQCIESDDMVAGAGRHSDAGHHLERRWHVGVRSSHQSHDMVHHCGYHLIEANDLGHEIHGGTVVSGYDVDGPHPSQRVSSYDLGGTSACRLQPGHDVDGGAGGSRLPFHDLECGRSRALRLGKSGHDMGGPRLRRCVSTVHLERTDLGHGDEGHDVAGRQRCSGDPCFDLGGVDQWCLNPFHHVGSALQHGGAPAHDMGRLPISRCDEDNSMERVSQSGGDQDDVLVARRASLHPHHRELPPDPCDDHEDVPRHQADQGDLPGGDQALGSAGLSPTIGGTMANQNYDQLGELFAQGKLGWETDSIVALLYEGATFDASDKTVADLPGQQRGVQPIHGRWYSNGYAMGLPVAFQKVSAGTEFQVVLAQNVGNNNPNLLAFIDSGADDSPITVQRTGTLIIRPVLSPIEVPPERPPTIGVWLRYPA